MKNLLSILKNYRRQIIVIAVLYLVSTVCGLLLPYIMSTIVSDGIEKSNANVIFRLGIIMLSVALVAFLSSLFTTKVNAKFSSSLVSDMQKSVFKKVNSLTFEEFSSIGTAGLLTRATDDVFALQDVVTSLLYAVVVVPIMFFGSIVLVAIKDYVLALLIISIAPLLVLFMRKLTKNIGPLWDEADRYIDIQNKVIRERLSGIRVIRAFNKENFEHERASNATKIMSTNIVKSNVLSGFIGPLCSLALNIVTVAVLYVGAERLQFSSRAVLTAGDVIATIQYIALMLNAVITVSWMFVWVPMSKVSIDRINQVFAMKGAPESKVTGVKFDGDVELKNVTFTYPDSQVPTLTDVTLSAKHGETVSIIGGTGSGKSTIVKLLLGFYPVKDGSISIDGKDYQDIGSADIRNNVAVTLQKSMIFDGTVEENIKMGYASATDEEVNSVVEIAQLKDFVDSHEEGLSYRLTQYGANISGGQKQRVSIARTVLKPASVYIFDDSFSALDFLTETNLRKALNKRLDGKTQIIITQRIATAMRSDKIYVLDGGKVVGVGSHDKLMQSCKIYKEIYRSQFGGDENEKV